MHPHLATTRRAHQALLACAGMAAGVVLLLRAYPPHAGSLYPACPFFAYTGLLCPGCGATRALSALARGHLHEALHQNALFVLLLPLVVLYGLAAYRRALRHRASLWPALPPAFPTLLAIVALGFTVARNLI